MQRHHWHGHHLGGGKGSRGPKNPLKIPPPINGNRVALPGLVALLIAALVATLINVIHFAHLAGHKSDDDYGARAVMMMTMRLLLRMDWDDDTAGH